MDEKKPDGNLANLVLVYILLQVVLIIFAIIVGDAIGISVEMLGLSSGKKLLVLLCICLLIVLVLYILRKRLLYHLSFEGISETIFPKKERQRMLELTKKMKSNSLTVEENREFEAILKKTYLPSDLATMYSKKHFSIKEAVGTALLFLFGSFFIVFVLKLTGVDNEKAKHAEQAKPETDSEDQNDLVEPENKKEGADEDTTPSTDG